MIVRYGPKHDALREWVFNEPRIDEAKVVWARDMGGAADAELVRYFPERQLVNDDGKPAELMPYPGG